MLGKAFCTKSSSWTAYKTCALSLNLTLELQQLTSTSLHPFEQGMLVTRFSSALLRRNMRSGLPGWPLIQLVFSGPAAVEPAAPLKIRKSQQPVQKARGSNSLAAERGARRHCADLSTD